MSCEYGGKGIRPRFAMDLITGAIGRLLPKLDVLFLKQEHNLQTSMEEDIKSLEIHLRRMVTGLCKMQRAQQEQDQLDPQDDTHCCAYELRVLSYDLEDKHCAYELRNLSYDIEDIVNNLFLSIEDGFEPMGNQDSFRETVEGIKAQVKKLAAWQTEFVAKPATTSTVVDASLEDGFMQDRQLVGIHKLTAELISRMSSPSQGLKTVSIWGGGGMGKTTLAKAVYENIKRDFNCCAFVSVSQQPDTKKTLRDILIHLDKKRYSDLNTSRTIERELINELQHFLKNRRFLIVIDDIRDMPSWEVIQCALVDNGCESRIITTSRVLDIAESSSEVLNLMPLSIDSCKELFYATLYGSKSTINIDPPDELTTEYILQICRWVPLAIIMIASLLAGNLQEEWTHSNPSSFCQKNQEEWTEVFIRLGQEDDLGNYENQTRKVIQFCYYDLPSHLKTCLLYLSIFPDGHVIEKDTLVWRWVAEGFVHEDQAQEESLFKVGERYFYELVSRNMIQAVENEDTNIRACRVESMVLDWIRTVAEGENFVNNTSAGRYGRYQHRSNIYAPVTAIHGSVVDEPHDLAKLKVRSFNGTDCSISTSTLRHTTFQVLRVLSLEDCKLTADCSDDLKNLIAGLIHLRYLGLGRTDIRDLEIETGRLRYLQTLDLTDTNIWALPRGVTQLRQLKCLRFVASTRLESLEGIGNLTSLEELRLGRVEKLRFLARELSKLPGLRVLHIHTTYILGEKPSSADLVPLTRLQKIEVLELRMGSQEPWHLAAIGPGVFPKLRYLKMDTWPILQPGAIPQLKSVVLVVHVRALKDGSFDFHDFYKLSYLRFLEKAHVGINCQDAETEEAEEAELALRCAVQSHPNRPKIILYRVGRCVDDKQIHSFGGLHGSQLAPQVMPLGLLRKITKDFSHKQRLGSGTFGAVYKGDLDGKEVAVKLLHSMAQKLNYEEEFMKEFENLRRLKHPNIVQLLGYCYEIKCECVEYGESYVLADKIYRALCFDYMHNGSLQRHLDDEVNRLNWPTCYQIIKGTCEGLKYLHEGSKTPMYHLDLKPGNILLDKNMVPKIADFGLSKLVLDNETRATSSFLGTRRYCPPEYIEQGYVSNKFDIFSLGVVMIEIIAGPEGYCKAAEMPSQEFIDHVQENWRERLEETSGCTSLIYECFQVKRCIEIALECVSADRKQRPNIGDITGWLNQIKNNKLDTTSTSQDETWL